MPRVIRKGVDNAQSHGYDPLGVITSTNAVKTYANNILIAVIGDPYTSEHCIPVACHGMGNATVGSPDVIVEGIGVHRDADLIDCGTVADNGSPDVFADSGPGAPGGGGPGGEEGEDTVGYVPGTAIVQYQGGVITEDDFIDLYPWDGVQNAGWTPIHEEDPGDQGMGQVVAKNYPTVGIFPPNSEIPAFWQDPIPLEYESQGMPGGMSLNPITGHISGSTGQSSGSVLIRAKNNFWGDYDPDEGDGVPKWGPWWSIPITE
jgi:hypothetical protein